MWGYTDQARRIKKTVTVTKSAKGRTWDFESFKADVGNRLEVSEAKSVLAFYEFCRDLPDAELRWGSGPKRGSFSVAFPPAIPRSILTGLSDGELWLNFHLENQTDAEIVLRDTIFEQLNEIPTLGLKESDRHKWPVLKIAKWLPVITRIEEAIRFALAATETRSSEFKL